MEHLAREIKEDFVSQFEEFREALIRDRLIPIEKLTIEQERLGNQIKNDFIGLAAGSAFMMLSAAPVLLLGLWIGWRPKIKLLSLLKEYMYVRGERDQFVEQFNSEIKKLNSEMDSKNKALLRAVKRLEVKVHPRIQEIARLICEAERVEFSASDPESENIPDVEPYLRHTGVSGAASAEAHKVPGLNEERGFTGSAPLPAHGMPRTKIRGRAKSRTRPPWRFFARGLVKSRPGLSVRRNGAAEV